MAKNKAAKIQSLGTYVYKNSRFKELCVGNKDVPRRAKMEQYIYIPSMSNINDGVISKMNKGTYDGKNYYYISEDMSSKSVLDFGDNDITFMDCDRNQGDKSLGLINPEVTSITLSQSNTVDLLYDGELYGLATPLKLKGYVSGDPNLYYSCDGFISQWAINTTMLMSDNKIAKPIDFASKRYLGSKNKKMSAMYDKDNDAFLIPASYSMPSYYENQSVIRPDNEGYVGYNLYKEDIGQFGIFAYEYVNINGKNEYYSIDFNNIAISDSAGLNGKIYLSTPTIEQGGTRGNVISMMYLGDNYRMSTKFSLPYINNWAAQYTYAFIYDDVNDKINMLYVYGTMFNNLVHTIIFPLDMLKVVKNGDDITGSFDVENVVREFLGPTIDSDKVPKPDDELFNDNGPDINGAGDPYNTDEFNNVGSSVGGNADTSKDLNSVDATPNTAFNNFMQDTGYFGSYVLSNSDLLEYTNTLKMLYSHADDIFFGEAAGLQADRITKNTIGLHMLPLSVPAADYGDTVFAMGNVAIAATESYSDYIVGNNYAHANYLTKLTRTFNVPLGTIKHNYDNFLDFAPYSSASLYIPYIGKVELPINLVQSTSTDSRYLRLEFRVDYSSGDFMAILFCTIKDVEIAISHWNGNCARPIKVSVDDDSSAIIAGANRLASMFSFAASGGSSAITSGSAGMSLSHSDPVGNGMDYAKTMESAHESRSTTRSSSANSGVSYRGPSMPTSVTTNQHMIGNGTATGELGYLGIQDIILTVERPVWWKPYDYGNLVGYPTKKVAKLASVKGFARISDAHIRCKATATEKNEIATLLSEGVIF